MKEHTGNQGGEYDGILCNGCGTREENGVVRQPEPKICLFLNALQGHGKKKDKGICSSCARHCVRCLHVNSNPRLKRLSCLVLKDEATEM